MKISLVSVAIVALATPSLANIWGGKAAYNKWHETELERWLSDHSIPYPAPADRKDLEDLMKSHWEDKISKPYNSWNTQQLYSYLSSKGQDVKKGTEKNKDSLLSQVQGAWYETSDKANDAYGNVENWIFDSWTESQLKSFLDYHGIPNPSPRTRDSLLHTARANYQAAANKAGETFSYPGDWLYQQWSDSDLKEWADERGIPVPQPGTRDKLIANVRRNAKVAADDASAKLATASSSAAASQQSLSDTLIDAWSDSDLKAWFDKNGIKVPQGSKSNELKALARKHAARLTGDNVSGSAASAYGAATSKAGNTYAQATADAYGGFRHYYDLLANQFGFASAQASSSLSSASSKASVEASSNSKLASKSASSASSAASKSAGSAADKAGGAYSKATQGVKEEL
ncbi:hypothetical protein K431DRAFT_216742 [Polychaeton citri CBS 116435]|uniref:Stress response protein ish1 n=1 Tax=Polychaeton citri CBS 116435 TaxID=1314669 RepID=A0A9P4QFS6_9PEZI|nr:hypothetical protein K431DRAFT_216742 [Polychaeton citri CBS 116435]